MEKKTKLKKKGVFVYLAVFAGVIGLVFLPEIGGFVWHLFNENPVNHYGWEITVPNGWFVNTKKRELFMITLPRLYWLESRTEIYINAFDHLQYAKYDRKSWEKTEIPALRVRGYEITGARNIPVGGRSAYCVEAVSKDNELNVYHQCVLFEEQLQMSYRGPKKHLSQFYEITRKIQMVSLPNSPDGREN